MSEVSIIPADVVSTPFAYRFRSLQSIPAYWGAIPGRKLVPLLGHGVPIRAALRWDTDTPHELSYVVDNVGGLRVKMEHLKTLLIANRAEIATRILKTARCVEIAELLSSSSFAIH